MAVQQDAVDVYKEVRGDYDRFHQVMTERGYTDMQCLNLHRELLKEQGWIDPLQPFTPRTTLQLAKDVYATHKGEKEPFVHEMMAVGITKNAANSYYANIHGEAMTPRPVRQQPVDTLSQAIEAVYKRTIVVVMEIEVDDLEDTHQTAELAVELLNDNMDNQITLIAASEKV